MKQNVYFLFFSILLSCGLHAQKEANNWFFGYNAGLTWNSTQSLTATGLFGTANKELSGLATPVDGSLIYTAEGCFSLSDKNGNLLFYSDGMTIWNADHAPMSNADAGSGTGLTGHNSSTQSGIIIPNPGNPRQYYAITLNYNLVGKLSYSMVDMDLNGGLGDVVNDKKNILFTNGQGSMGESVTAVRHTNGKDYWVIAPGRGSVTYFNAWLITAAGVSATPVITTSPIAETTNVTTGYIKLNPTGEYFVWPTGYGNKLIYGKFDSNTGIFSNIKALTNFSIRPYGCEFSPSSKYFYLSGIDGGRGFYAYKFADLIEADDPTTVSYYFQTFPSQPGAFQLSPDGRIYISINSANYLYLIDNPEDYDNLRIYQLPIGFLSAGSSKAGLPSFSASWWVAPIGGETQFCINTNQTFSIYITKGSGIFELSHTEWDFGDGSNVITDNNFSSGKQEQSHTYKTPGSYTITVKAFLASDGTEIIDARQTFEVYASRCVMPVNPNIHIYN